MYIDLPTTIKKIILKKIFFKSLENISTYCSLVYGATSVHVDLPYLCVGR